MWLLSRVESGSYKLTEFRDDDSVPQYAVLSHTWIQRDEAEPTFRDLKEGTGQDKAGYEKIKFCGQRARRDELEYFWVDTCCINKENPSELSHAIRSMFRWYRNSAVCYVYLSDVYDSSVRRSWDSEFYRSRRSPAFQAVSLWDIHCHGLAEKSVSHGRTRVRHVSPRIKHTRCLVSSTWICR